MALRCRLISLHAVVAQTLCVRLKSARNGVPLGGSSPCGVAQKRYHSWRSRQGAWTIVALSAALINWASWVRADDQYELLGAAVKQFQSSLSSIRVDYVENREVVPYEGAFVGEMEVRWLRSGRKQSYFWRAVSQADFPIMHWVYDGQQTSAISYVEDDYPQIGNVDVSDESLKQWRVNLVMYAWLDASNLPSVNLSLVDLWSATADGKVVHNDDGGFQVTFDEVIRPTGSTRVTATFDDLTSGVPRSIHSHIVEREPLPERTFEAITRVDEFEVITDPLTGSPLRLPLMGTFEYYDAQQSLMTRTSIEVRSLKINEEIADSEFEIALPFGTSVTQQSAMQGGHQRRYLVGGERAVEARLKLQQAEVAVALDELGKRGVRFDATPQCEVWWQWTPLILGSVSLAAVLALLYLGRRF